MMKILVNKTELLPAEVINYLTVDCSTIRTFGRRNIIGGQTEEKLNEKTNFSKKER